MECANELASGNEVDKSSDSDCVRDKFMEDAEDELVMDESNEIDFDEDESDPLRVCVCLMDKRSKSSRAIIAFNRGSGAKRRERIRWVSTNSKSSNWC